MLSPDELINLLQLAPLPHEGGYFKVTYQSEIEVPAEHLPARYGRNMPLGSAIYYLLTADNFSAMHRLESDELYHFYYGDPVELLLLSGNGQGQIVTLGTAFDRGMRPQVLVPKDIWQGSILHAKRSFGYALVGTTMMPAYHDEGFELGERGALQAAYPAWTEAIAKRTRQVEG